MTLPDDKKPAKADDGRNQDHLIYVVEDEHELREILGEALTHIGHRTRMAANGQGLLDLLEEETPDLILMDIGLPDMSGWDLRKRIQEDSKHAKVPVIAVTGYGGPTVESTALKTLNFSDYLRKPYSLADLMNRIERVIEKEGTQKEADESQTEQTQKR